MKGKKLLVFSILCIAAGLLCLLFSGVRSSDDLWLALDRIGAVERQEKKNVEVTEPFTSLRVQEGSADVQLLPSEDGGCRVVYGEGKYSRCRVSVENGTLTVVRETEEHSRSGLFSIEDTLPVCIYLPAGDYETLSVSSASGDVKTSAGLGFQKAAIDTGSGDIRLESLEAETLSAKTGSGKVKLRSCSAASLTLESSSGDLTVKGTVCSGDGKLHSGSGDIELEDSSFRALGLSTTSGKTTLSKTVCSGSVKAESGSGDIRLRKASAASFDFRSTSGNVKGSVVGSVDFIVESSSGSVRTRGGVRGAAACRVRTGSGDVDLEIDG